MQDTRKEIKTIALNKFIDIGYDQVSLNDIVRSSNKSKGSLYNYFKSKNQLLEEVAIDLLTSAYNYSNNEWSDKNFNSLDAFFTAYVEHIILLIKNIGSPIKLMNVLMFIAKASVEFDSVRELRKKNDTKIHDDITAQLRTIENSKISNFDELAQIIMDLVEGVATNYASGVISLDEAHQLLLNHFEFIAK